MSQLNGIASLEAATTQVVGASCPAALCSTEAGSEAQALPDEARCDDFQTVRMEGECAEGHGGLLNHLSVGPRAVKDLHEN